MTDKPYSLVFLVFGVLSQTMPLITTNQNVIQSVGTPSKAYKATGTRYVTANDNWSQKLAVNLARPGAQAVTITPCPLGIDTTHNANQPYKVHIPTAHEETVEITGGTCTSGASGGTITFTTALAHSTLSNVIESSTSGIQEALNDACGTASSGNPNCRIAISPVGGSANVLPIYSTVFVHCSRCLIEGDGMLLSCSTRDRCIVLGDLKDSKHYGGVTLRGVNITSTVNADGCQITNTQRQSNVVTITVASGCSTIQVHRDRSHLY